MSKWLLENDLCEKKYFHFFTGRGAEAHDGRWLAACYWFPNPDELLKEFCEFVSGLSAEPKAGANEI